MSKQKTNEEISLRYSIDENPPLMLSAGLGLQIVILIIGGIVLGPMIVLRAADQPDVLVEWAIFAGLLVSGITTIIQARPIWRFGAGFVLFMGTSGAFMAISIDAIKAGGIPLLASLVVASSLIQFLFSFHLAKLRSIVTPTVGGIVILLIAVTVFPIAFNMLNQTPANTEEGSFVGPLIAIVSFGVILAISFFAKGAVRLWGPVIGVLAGCLLAGFYGALDFSKVAQADWIGFPTATWPGLDASFRFEFWMLLIPFVIVTIVGAIETYGDGVAIQKLSHREAQPTDYRAVQGAVNADGLGNLLSGLMGTLPNTTYSTSLSVVDLTGVAARAVGIFGGAILVLIAFSPKFANLLMAIPTPVAGAYIMVLLMLLFLHGLRLIAEEGLDFEKGLVVCVSFWLGSGFQEKMIFHDHMPNWLTGLLDNGMTAGGLTAIILMSLLKLRSKGTQHVELPAETISISTAQRFVDKYARSQGWAESPRRKLELVLEEAMLFLLEGSSKQVKPKDLRIGVQVITQGLQLELLSGNSQDNFDSVSQAINQDQEPSSETAGLRILNSLADTVSHRQFHGTDVLVIAISK